VSTPVTWDEVERCVKEKDPSLLVFEADKVIERANRVGDLFEPVLRLQQKLPELKALQQLFRSGDLKLEGESVRVQPPATSPPRPTAKPPAPKRSTSRRARVS
jgi:bifunctional non-homologous end joining protein LigD